MSVHVLLRGCYIPCFGIVSEKCNYTNMHNMYISVKLHSNVFVKLTYCLMKLLAGLSYSHLINYSYEACAFLSQGMLFCFGV